MYAGSYGDEGIRRSGDQLSHGSVGHWNANVRDHALTELPMKLFLMEGSAVKFLGCFNTDSEEVFNWAVAERRFRKPQVVV